jgi:hypothetical protein
MHWPVAFSYSEESSFPTNEISGLINVIEVPIADTWAAMETLVEKGMAKSIGISNFTLEKSQELLKGARIAPAVNQIEAHPYLQQVDLLEWSQKNVCFAFSLQTTFFAFSRTLMVVEYPRCWLLTIRKQYIQLTKVFYCILLPDNSLTNQPQKSRR